MRLCDSLWVFALQVWTWVGWVISLCCSSFFHLCWVFRVSSSYHHMNLLLLRGLFYYSSPLCFSPQLITRNCELHQLGHRLLSRYVHTKAAAKVHWKFVWIFCPKCTTSCPHVSCPQIQFAFLTWFHAHHNGASESIYFPVLKLGFRIRFLWPKLEIFFFHFFLLFNNLIFFIKFIGISIRTGHWS